MTGGAVASSSKKRNWLIVAAVSVIAVLGVSILVANSSGSGKVAKESLASTTEERTSTTEELILSDSQFLEQQVDSIGVSVEYNGQELMIRLHPFSGAPQQAPSPAVFTQLDGYLEVTENPGRPALGSCDDEDYLFERENSTLAQICSGVDPNWMEAETWLTLSVVSGDYGLSVVTTWSELWAEAQQGAVWEPSFETPRRIFCCSPTRTERLG